MEDNKIAYKIFLTFPRRKRSLSRPRHRP